MSGLCLVVVATVSALAASSSRRLSRWPGESGIATTAPCAACALGLGPCRGRAVTPSGAATWGSEKAGMVWAANAPNPELGSGRGRRGVDQRTGKREGVGGRVCSSGRCYGRGGERRRLRRRRRRTAASHYDDLHRSDRPACCVWQQAFGSMRRRARRPRRPSRGPAAAACPAEEKGGGCSAACSAPNDAVVPFAWR